jgi:hypothetical protein
MNSVAAEKKRPNRGVFANLPSNSGSGLTATRRLGGEARFVFRRQRTDQFPEWMFIVYAEQTFRMAAPGLWLSILLYLKPAQSPPREQASSSKRLQDAGRDSGRPPSTLAA